MERTTVIKNLGTVVLKDVSLGDGQIEIHLPIECVSDSLEKVLDNCMEDFKSKHTTESDNDVSFVLFRTLNDAPFFTLNCVVSV